MMFIHDDSLKFPTLKQRNLDVGRVYEVLNGSQAGRFYPSITRVLKAKPKPELEAWKARVGPEAAGRESARATTRGNSIHSLAECYLSNDQLPQFGPQVGELWSRLRAVIDTHITTVYAQEQDVYCERLGVAGRMDLLALWDQELSVIDFKNSKKPKKAEWVEDYFIQSTFYALSVYERTGVMVKQIVVPIVSPSEIQLFVGRTTNYMRKLVESVDLFYASYEKELDLQSQVC